MSPVIACMHLKHNSWPTPCYLCGVGRGSRQPMTGRLATHTSNRTVKRQTDDSAAGLYESTHSLARSVSANEMQSTSQDNCEHAIKR